MEQTLGERLSGLLADSGMSYGQLTRRVAMALGPDAPSHQKIGQVHRGKVSPERADLVLLATLADIYDVEVSSLHPVVAQRFGFARKVLVRSRCFAGTDSAHPVAA